MDVQPSANADRVLALIVTADKYDPKLSYSLTAGGTTKKVVLDGPQLFLGGGMVSARVGPRRGRSGGHRGQRRGCGRRHRAGSDNRAVR